MAGVLSKVDSCPFCWASKHSCQRDPITGVCRDCKAHVTRMLDGGGIVSYSPSFYDSAAHAELFKNTELRSLPSIDTIGPQDVNTFGVKIITSDGQTSKPYAFRVKGPFSTRNEAFIQELDTMVRECLTISLQDRDGYCHAVRKVTLAGGYAHLLCSTIQATEQVSTTRDGANVDNEHDQHNLLIHFRFIVLCRLSELIKESMDAIRFEDPDNELPAYTADAFASAVILRYEMSYFARSLRNGELSSIGHMSDGLKTIVVAWFAAIEHELTQRLRLGCGQHTHWQGTITGSKKRSRRRAQTLSLALALNQTKHTVGEPPPAPNFYNTSGNGSKYLLSSPASPTMLAVPDLSFADSTGEIEQIPPSTHVSGPLPNPFGTWEETSVSGISDLFPDSQHYLR